MGTVHLEIVARFHHILNGHFSKTSLANYPKCVNVSQFMSAKPVAKWAMPVGNYTVWNMESNPMVKCLLTRPSVVVMTPSTPSFLKLDLANMYPVQFSSTWNLLSLMKSVLEPTVDCSTLNNWLLERKMLPITTLEDTIPLARKS